MTTPTSTPRIKRQATAVEADILSTTYNNGLYTQSTAIAVASSSTVAGFSYSSFDSSSLRTESIDEPSSLSDSPTSASVAVTTIVTLTTSATSFSASLSASPSLSAQSLSATSTASSTTNQTSHPINGLQFHLTYLIPLFAIVGLVLFLAVGGKVWGRIVYAKERAIWRRTRPERQLIRDQRKERKERVERIRLHWEQNGWGENVSPDVSFEKQHQEEEWDSDISENELKGPLSAIGTHLAGVKQGTPLPPAKRIVQGRYSAKVEANNWLGVQWMRKFRRIDQNEKCTGLSPNDSPGIPSLRATLRGTWDRVKLKMSGNVGWGYEGTTPDISQRRELIANASSSHLSSRLPLPHTPSGLLYPPQLNEDGRPTMPTPKQSRRFIFPLAAHRREGSYSPPQIKTPPNTIRVLPSSSSRTAFTSVKGFFVGFRSRSSQSFTEEAHRGEHERLQSEEDILSAESSPLFSQIVQDDVISCSLTEPEYLLDIPLLSEIDLVERYLLHDEPQQYPCSESPGYTPTKSKASVRQKATQVLGDDEYKPIREDTIGTNWDEVEDKRERSRSKVDRQSRKGLKHTKTGKSVRSYTESVKFGDVDEEEEEQEKEVKKMPIFPSVDSQFLPRTRTMKSGLTRLAMLEKPEETDVLHLSQSTHASQSEKMLFMRPNNDIPIEGDDFDYKIDVESEIDTALTNLIERSSASKSSYYYPSSDTQTPKRDHTFPSPVCSTPTGKKTSWRERNGKWERIGEAEEDAIQQENETSPAKTFSYTASPPPLPPPPVAWKHSPSMTRSIAYPASLSTADGAKSTRSIETIEAERNTTARSSGRFL